MKLNRVFAIKVDAKVVENSEDKYLIEDFIMITTTM